ncbi:receptor activity-modifying protein 3 [Leuresthes tenuis]|uniref:receptor activity-modifying protein 3 n=1 Tax=Leuresthes tenuis TaxID=355514 RepID=UPI003B50A125
MILSLLHALMLGIVTSQQADTAKEERSTALTNQTFSIFTNDNSKFISNNATFRPFNATEIEDKLQGNRTSGFITEDDERFQDEQNQASGENCNGLQLIDLSRLYCGEFFREEMQLIGAENWCVLDDVIRPYHELTECVETVANAVGCFFPNPDIQDFFVHIHSIYFESCPEEEDQFEDAPQSLVVVLTVVPVCLIPVLVYLVVWKS